MRVRGGGLPLLGQSGALIAPETCQRLLAGCQRLAVSFADLLLDPLDRRRGHPGFLREFGGGGWIIMTHPPELVGAHPSPLGDLQGDGRAPLGGEVTPQPILLNHERGRVLGLLGVDGDVVLPTPDCRLEAVPAIQYLAVVKRNRGLDPVLCHVGLQGPPLLVGHIAPDRRERVPFERVEVHLSRSLAAGKPLVDNRGSPADSIRAQPYRLRELAVADAPPECGSAQADDLADLHGSQNPIQRRHAHASASSPSSILRTAARSRSRDHLRHSARESSVTPDRRRPSSP